MVILGLPTMKGENTTDLVRKVAASVGCELSEDAIQDARRLNSKGKNSASTSTAPIKVTFTEEQFKEDLFAQKKNHGQLLPSAVDAKFAAFKNRVVLRDEMTSFGMNLLKEAREADQKNAWRIVGDVLGRNGVNDAPRSVNKICQLFNEFFCSVGHKLAATIPSDRNICRFNTLPRRPDSMFLSPTTYNEVVSLINQLDTKKCAGPDNISATFIKVHYEVFAQLITDVFNEIIMTGQ
ncbi:hypothetical protein pipiens_019197, partial [Culex pipiens pipiens]